MPGVELPNVSEQGWVSSSAIDTDLSRRGHQGVGGAGKFKSVPYSVPELSLGDIKGENLAGVLDGPIYFENFDFATIFRFDSLESRQRNNTC